MMIESLFVCVGLSLDLLSEISGCWVENKKRDKYIERDKD